MALYVHKYGGTSVGTVDRIRHVAEKIGKARERGDDIIVVVSAMSGETNRLVALAREIQQQPNAREMDVLLSTGEQVTIALLCMALEQCGYPSCSYTGGQVRILTDDAHTKARIVDIDTDRIRRDLADGKIIVVAGFQGVSQAGHITTLGRGGSDTTAVALAAALSKDKTEKEMRAEVMAADHTDCPICHPEQFDRAAALPKEGKGGPEDHAGRQGNQAGAAPVPADEVPMREPPETPAAPSEPKPA